MTAAGETKMTTPKTQDAEASKSGSSDSSTEYVQYSGGASRREITVADWSKAGVTDMKADSNWTFANDFKLPKKDFSEKALDYLLGEQRSNGSKAFRIVTA